MKKQINSNTNIKSLFDYYVLNNIFICFVLLKNNSYDLFLHLHLIISNAKLSESIFNLLKNDESYSKKKNSYGFDNFSDENDRQNYLVKKKKINNYIHNFKNINLGENEEWGWFVYIE